MGRQRTVSKKVSRRKIAKDKPVGFYMKGVKTRPITKSKAKKTWVVKKVVRSATTVMRRSMALP